MTPIVQSVCSTWPPLIFVTLSDRYCNHPNDNVENEEQIIKSDDTQV